MQVVDIDRTSLGRLVAREETRLRAEAAMPLAAHVPAEDQEDHLERVRAVRYVAHYSQPYAPLIDKHRKNRK